MTAAEGTEQTVICDAPGVVEADDVAGAVPVEQVLDLEVAGA